MKYQHIIHYVRSTPWAIMHSKMAEIQAFLYEKAHGIEVSEEEINARIGAKAKPRASQKGGVLVMDVFGVMEQRAQADVSSGGIFNIEKFTAKFRQAVANPDIKAIVLNIDSPGGSVFGVQELGDEIFKARENKHIVAVANSLAASAAYWVATQADELVVTPSGQVGSIGVFTVHQDLSEAFKMKGVENTIIEAGKFKTEASALKPLTEEAIDAIQADVNFYYDAFVNSVARGRGVGVSDVRNGFGEGRAVNAKVAKREGMVDKIATLDEVLTSLGVGAGAQGDANTRTSVALAAQEMNLH